MNQSFYSWVDVVVFFDWAPWFDLRGWLGVKCQVTKSSCSGSYLPARLGVPLGAVTYSACLRGPRGLLSTRTKPSSLSTHFPPSNFQRVFLPPINSGFKMIRFNCHVVLYECQFSVGLCFHYISRQLLVWWVLFLCEWRNTQLRRRIDITEFVHMNEKRIDTQANECM